MSFAKAPALQTSEHVPCQTYSAAGRRQRDITEVRRIAAEAFAAVKGGSPC